jgi:hypothetical protein
MFFIWAGRPLQQDHFEKSLYFSPLFKIFVFFTSLKTSFIFHLGMLPLKQDHFEKSMYFSPH